MRSRNSLMLVLVLLLGCSMVQERDAQACVADICYDIAVAQTQEEQSIGFMHDDPRIDGILFLFDKADAYCFWMKNTSMPLMILWLDDQDVVRHIEHGAPYDESLLCPRIRSSKVLELRSSLDPHIIIGTRIEFPVR